MASFLHGSSYVFNALAPNADALLVCCLASAGVDSLPAAGANSADMSVRTASTRSSISGYPRAAAACGWGSMRNSVGWPSSLQPFAVLPSTGVNGAHKERHEWLSKGSSRLWRGSMRNSSWRHIGKGAWEPR
eukprot:1159023-Pelagomonas_calceolata.AAC.2